MIKSGLKFLRKAQQALSPSTRGSVEPSKLPNGLTFKVLHAARATDIIIVRTVCPEKETKMFFCNIFYKSHAILMTFGVEFSE